MMVDADSLPAPARTGDRRHHRRRDRPEFAGRQRTVLLDGVSVTGWFTHDFTRAELKTLRAVERLPAVRQRNTLYNGLFAISTFEEVLELRARLSRELDRTIGVYPETKHPTDFQNLGLPLEPQLVATLRRHGFDSSHAPVVVQSFEAHNLRDLTTKCKLRTRKVFLTSAAGTPINDPRPYADYLTPAGLAELNDFVDGTLGTPTALVANAQAALLVLPPYTFRAQNQFLPTDLRVTADPNAYGRATDEQIAFLRTGIHRLFTDRADIGVLARSLV